MSTRPGPYGNDIRTCDHCGADMQSHCPSCFPIFGTLSGMRTLAAALLRHQGYDPQAYPDLVTELENTIGEELLAIGREALAARGMEVLGPLEVGSMALPAREVTFSLPSASRRDRVRTLWPCPRTPTSPRTSRPGTRPARKTARITARITCTGCTGS